MVRSSRFTTLLLVALISGACGQDPAASVAPSANAPTEPAFELTVARADAAQDGPEEGTYASTQGATTTTCSQTGDGFWLVRYSGGEPFISLDLLVGPGAANEGTSEDVSAEIILGSPLVANLVIDQPGHRSGDRPGRSTASIETRVGPNAVTWVVDATTPIRSITFDDLDPVEFHLIVTCPLE